MLSQRKKLTDLLELWSRMSEPEINKLNEFEEYIWDKGDLSKTEINEICKMAVASMSMSFSLPGFISKLFQLTLDFSDKNMQVEIDRLSEELRKGEKARKWLSRFEGYKPPTEQP